MDVVEVLALGPLSQRSILDAVKRRANVVQRHYRFRRGDPIQNLGMPDGEGRYPLTDLAALLEQRHQTAGYDKQETRVIMVGIVDLALRGELFSGVNVQQTAIVVSLNDTADMLQRTRRQPADYALLEIAAQLLAIEYRTEKKIKNADPDECVVPWHAETQACMFDYCDNRSDTDKKLIKPRLCSTCEHLFDHANVRSSVKTACLMIATSAVRPSMGTLLLEPGLVRPLLAGSIFSILSWTLGGFGWLPAAAAVVVVLGLIIRRRMPAYRTGP